MEELFIRWGDYPDIVKIFIERDKNGDICIEFFDKDFKWYQFDKNRTESEQVLEICATGMNSPWTGEVYEGFIEDELDRYDAECRYIYRGTSIVYDSIDFTLYGYGNTKEEAIKDYREKFKWLNTFLPEDFDEYIPK